MENKMFYYVMSYNEDYSIRTDIIALTSEDINNSHDIGMSLVDLVCPKNVDKNNICAIYTSDKVEDDRLFENKLYMVYRGV